LKGKIGDELIKDTLGNVALVRTVKRTVRFILEYKLVTELDVCLIVEKIASPIKHAYKHNGNGYEKEEAFDLSRIMLPEEWIKWRRHDMKLT
jgi:hypothetical protein